MELTKYTHACVRLTDGERDLVIDPGTWSEPEAITGVSHVLVTHEHADHLNVDLLAAAVQDDPDFRVYAHADVASQLGKLGEAVVSVAPGDELTVAGYTVRVVGGMHAEIYDGLPGCANVGYIVDTPSGPLYHPGDALFVPEEHVEHLLVPVSGPWLSLAQAIDFVRAVAPGHAHPIHDALYTDIAFGLVDRWLSMKGETQYHRIPVGEAVGL